ncbi:MAG: AbrB/MazE/SpoVT family DNA-binding domain-containing protein [Verrucomicrobiales bacterium]|nr:AbrB/MazE/SpoVT family DNA-binding domain-containing protein [Verrucomicrobiales bacterium]
MKITSKGQVTIPQHIRRFMGVSTASEVDFQILDEVVVLVKANLDVGTDARRSRFACLRGSKRRGLSTDEWMNATRGE